MQPGPPAGPRGLRAGPLPSPSPSPPPRAPLPLSAPPGFVLFLFLGILTMLRPNTYFMAPLQEKVVFGMFFLGAVLCLSFSWLFHTVYCHSEKVSRTFSK